MVIDPFKIHDNIIKIKYNAIFLSPSRKLDVFSTLWNTIATYAKIAILYVLHRFSVIDMCDDTNRFDIGLNWSYISKADSMQQKLSNHKYENYSYQDTGK